MTARARVVASLLLADLTPSWVDQVAVDRCLAGRDTGRPLHRAERLAVTRALLAAGHSTAEIARRIPCCDRDATQLVKEARAC